MFGKVLLRILHEVFLSYVSYITEPNLAFICFRMEELLFLKVVTNATFQQNFNANVVKYI